MESAHAAADRQGGAVDPRAAACRTAASISTSKGRRKSAPSVKAYFALKLAGVPADDPRMVAAARAHPRARRHSGGQQLRQGQPQPLRSVSARSTAPAFRRKSCCCRCNFSTRCRRGRARSWSRSRSCMPRIRSARAGGFNLDEICAARREPGFRSATSRWFTLAQLLSRGRSLAEVVGAARLEAHPRRARSRRPKHWMLERMQHSDGLGAIYPPMMYSIMALDVLGYRAGRSGARRGAAAVRQPDAWMTASASSSSRAFRRSGTRRSARTPWRRAGPRIRALRGARPTGCSRRKSAARATGPSSGPNTEPSGWAFEYRNEFYPDIDDTAMVMLALSACRGDRTPRRRRHCASARLDWLLAMQSQRRRLGGVRRRQQLGVPEQRSVRRSQRHARSDLPRYHRPRARSAGGARARPRSPAVRRGVD